MGNFWLSYYTRSVNPELLQSDTEQQATTIYSRWRSLTGWLADVLLRAREARAQRAGQRELLAMPEHLLRDVGLLRDGTLQRLVRVPQPTLIAGAATLGKAGSDKRCPVVPLDAPIGPDMIFEPTIDRAARAA